MQVITLQDKAFEQLIDAVIEQVKNRLEVPDEIWVDKNRAKEILGIRSDQTLLTYRERGEITYSLLTARNVMYHKESLYDFIRRRSVPAKHEGSIKR